MKIRRDGTMDEYHGWRVADPFRWLEDTQSEDTRQWVAGQTAATEARLDTPLREELRARLSDMWNYDKYGVPEEFGGRYFFTRQSGLQNQPVLCMQEGLDGSPEELVDPNILRADGAAALTCVTSSRDGRYVAYCLSESGSDWQTVHVYDVDERRSLPDVLNWCKFTRPAWHPDASGFYYARFPAVEEQDQYAELNRHHLVYFHTLGQAQEQDRLIHERPDAPDLTFSPHVTSDGEYLYLIVTDGTDPRTRVHIRALAEDGPFARTLDGYDAMYIPIGNDGPIFYVHTDHGAPRGRLVAIDIRQPGPEHWREVIGEQSDVLESALIVADRLVVVYMHDAHHLLRLFHKDGQPAGDVPLPAIGSIVAASGEPDGTDLFLGFTSFFHPLQPLRYHVPTGELTAFQAAATPFDVSRYETTQVFYPSADGTLIPMFLTHRKGISADGTHRAMLYGYGGFNISLTPSFSLSRLLWLERGGIYAVANLRGGNEYGEAWHKAGMMHNKQTVFDDFIAAAQWLVAAGYTTSRRLAVNGGSNGGLLVAACMLQRPDLFGAVVSQVPVTDMLRFHRFTAGRFWTSEYGNAEADAADFRTLYAYSPLHNVRVGAVYPPILITTGDTDDRVVPAHSYKFTATLQYAAHSSQTVLLRVETNAGHGAGKPTAKQIAEIVDVHAFLSTELADG